MSPERVAQPAKIDAAPKKQIARMSPPAKTSLTADFPARATRLLV
jgi:hypothetical protein